MMSPATFAVLLRCYKQLWVAFVLQICLIRPENFGNGMISCMKICISPGIDFPVSWVELLQISRLPPPPPPRNFQRHCEKFPQIDWPEGFQSWIQLITSHSNALWSGKSCVLRMFEDGSFDSESCWNFVYSLLTTRKTYFLKKNIWGNQPSKKSHFIRVWPSNLHFYGYLKTVKWIFFSKFVIR